MAVAMPLACLVRPDLGKLPGHHAIHGFGHTLRSVSIRKIDLDPNLAKSLQRTGPDTADHDGAHSLITEKLHRHHAATGTVLHILNAGHAVDSAFPDLNDGEHVAVTEMV